MRAFLDAFFARHFFQVQDSFLEYIASSGLGNVMNREALHIADIGSGPAVATLAIVDALDTALHHLDKPNKRFGRRKINVTTVLNDTSEVCLDTGQAMLKAYSRARTANSRVDFKRVIPLATPFPESVKQLNRMARFSEPFDFSCFGYVLDHLEEQSGAQAAFDGIRQLVKAGNPQSGRILIIQDKFHESLHRRLCRSLGTSLEQTEIKQHVYDSANQNSEYTYTFFRSFYPQMKDLQEHKPREQTLQQASVARYHIVKE
jgi:hypothetical protein